MSTITEEIALNVTGMDCASCVSHVDKALRSTAGVKEVAVNLARGRAMVTFDPAATNPESLANAVEGVGYGATPEAAASARASEEDRLNRQSREAAAWRHRAIAGVALWLPVELTHWILHAIHAGDAATMATMPGLSSGSSVDAMTIAALITSTISIVYVGGKFYRSAFAALARRTTNMDVLIAMGATVAYAYSLILLLGGSLRAWDLPPGDHLFFMEASGLLALISLGHWLEARARRSAGRAIHELLDLTPATATLLLPPLPAGEGTTQNSMPGQRSGSFASDSPAQREIPVEQLHPGDRILIRPGARIPVDGVVLTGTSAIDESMITGESLPATRSPGDPVIGGTVNRDGALTVRVTKTGADTALAQIVKLVETAQNSRPPVQKLADQIAAIFVPTVLGLAVVTAIGWIAYGSHIGLDHGTLLARTANAVCSVLIIACPCALGLAVPAALMVGTGRGARQGVLLRDIDALQQAERIDTIVLDKTGTVTTGTPRVVLIIPGDGVSEAELLALAASAEQFSEHPLAKAIVADAVAKQIALLTPSDFSSEPGRGVTATIGGRTIVVGRDASVLAAPGSAGGYAPREGRLAGETMSTAGELDRSESNSLPRGIYPPAEPGAANANAGAYTQVHIVEDRGGQPAHLGTIELTDTIKPDSATAIAALKRAGLHVMLLSGDRLAVAEAVAREVGIADVRADVLPADKAAVIRELQAAGRKVAMVGDGVNDAPALAAADLGIAIGSGSDIAKEAGAIILVSGSLLGVALAIGLSRATMRCIRQNLFFAFIYNVIAIPLAACGFLTPLISAGAMALSDVTVIGNALRLRRSKISQ